MYFSLGTNIPFAQLRNDTLKTIVEALALLPYNILLKSDIENIPGMASNVMIRQWFPQQDILGKFVNNQKKNM